MNTNTAPTLNPPTNRLAAWAERRPGLFALALFLSVMIGYILTQLLMKPLSGVFTPDMLNVVANGVLLLPYAVLTTAMGWWRETFFRAPKSWKDLRLLWLPALVVAAMYSGNQIKTGGGVVFILVAAIFTALLEELVYRGLILRAFLPGGARRAILLSAIPFAAMHLDRLLGGAPLVETLAQLVIGTGVGIFAAALTLRTGSIWPAILYHIGHDFLVWLGMGGLTPAFEPSGPWIAFLLGGQAVLLVYGIILIRGLPAAKSATATQP